MIVVLGVMLGLKKLVNFKTKQKTVTHLLDFVNFNKPATHLEGVCWGPLSLISWESWYSYVSAGEGSRTKAAKPCVYQVWANTHLLPLSPMKTASFPEPERGAPR